MKTPRYIVRRIHPAGVNWHVWRHRKTGELRSQYRPLGRPPFCPGKQWEHVRSVRDDPKLNYHLFLQALFDGL